MCVCVCVCADLQEEKNRQEGLMLKKCLQRPGERLKKEAKVRT